MRAKVRVRKPVRVRVKVRKPENSSVLLVFTLYAMLFACLPVGRRYAIF